MAIEQAKPQSKVIELQGCSCYLFGTENKFRNICKSVICHPNFDNLILYLILFSTIMLCIENPLENPLGEKKQVMNQIDFMVTILFTMELVTKVIVFGFLMNGETSYMKNPWNIMDFIIVTVSVVSIIFDDI